MKFINWFIAEDDIASSEELIKVVNSFGHWMSNLIVNGHSTCNMAAHIDTGLVWVKYLFFLKCLC